MACVTIKVDASLQGHPQVEWVERQVPRTQQKRLGPITGTNRTRTEVGGHLLIILISDLDTDPLWGSQWHMHNSAGFDLAVMPAWERGLTGSGIGISIADDGIEWRHGDFERSRYIADGSHDWNSRDDDPSPSSYDDTHGTCICP